MKRYYVASKLHHSLKWRTLYRNQPQGFHMTSRWPFVDLALTEDPETLKTCAKHFWTDDIEDVVNSDFLILYVEPLDLINGALVEVGAALASGLTVYIVGENERLKSWVYHPNIIKLDTLEEVFKYELN